MPGRLLQLVLLAAMLPNCGMHCLTLHADTVVLSSGDEGTIEITGTVADYTGQTITVRRPTGTERDFAAERVIRVDTEWPAGFEQGRTALEEGNYPLAINLLASAARADQRAWVRRLAMQDLMQCYAAAGDPATAGRLLVELVKSDPTTAAIHHAPLAWQASNQVPQAIVAEWQVNNSPTSQLLAASYALSGSERSQATKQLKVLVRGGDKALAQLAMMQLWRAEIATATPDDIAGWEQRLAKVPPELQAGGWMVVGDAWRQRRQADAAALAYLRSTMLATRQPQLAAQAMWQAARVLDRDAHSKEKQSREKLSGEKLSSEAKKLIEQLLRDYPKTAAANEARRMLQSSR